MNFFQDGGFVNVPVQWFFLPPGSPILPFPTVFVSRNYGPTNPEFWPPVGEEPGPFRPFYNGTDSFGSIGSPIIGSAEDFVRIPDVEGNP